MGKEFKLLKKIIIIEVFCTPKVISLRHNCFQERHRILNSLISSGHCYKGMFFFRGGEIAILDETSIEGKRQSLFIYSPYHLLSAFQGSLSARFSYSKRSEVCKFVLLTVNI